MSTVLPFADGDMYGNHVDEWANLDDHAPVDNGLYPAGSGPVMNSKLQLDFSYSKKNEPETPLRLNNNSLSHFSGLVTPQSAGRSFSLPAQTPQVDRSLPSPVDTPLGTPLEMQVYGTPYDFPSFTDDYGTKPASAQISRQAARSIPTSRKSSVSSGVNPFYCPPSCLIDNSRSRSNSTQSQFDGLEFSDAGIQLNNSSFYPSQQQQQQQQTPLQYPPKASTCSPSNLIVDDFTINRTPNEVDPQKPFVCDLCAKGFRRMEHLRRHTKTHTRERPYTCTVPDCGRKFSRSDNLKAHILTHTKRTGRNKYVEALADLPMLQKKKRK